MAINWFPGHMHKATKEIKQLLPKVDAIIEVLDARIPYSSSNPVVAKFRRDIPTIKLLNKTDLADPEMTALWREHFEAQDQTTSLAVSAMNRDQVMAVMTHIRKMFADKIDALKPVNVMITGIPNVGKSTIINVLAGRTIAKTGNEPAVTKGQQKIHLPDNVYLWDTPGILWGKLVNQNGAYRLAATGAIKETAISNDEIGAWTAECLLERYPDALVKRYGLSEVPMDDIDFLETMGRKRGCLAGGGQIDFEKTAKILLTELRDGTLGRLSLEMPSDMVREEAEVEALLEAELAAKEEKKNNRKRKKR